MAEGELVIILQNNDAHGVRSKVSITISTGQTTRLAAPVLIPTFDGAVLGERSLIAQKAQ